jgi:hypothetical protein
MSECKHTWKTGPVTDVLARYRQVVCTSCWTLTQLPYDEAQRYPRWTDEDYEANRETVERIFG